MWKHIYGLDGGNSVVGIEVVEVTCLCGRIVTDINDAQGAARRIVLTTLGCMPARGGGVNDDSWTVVLGDELVGEDVLHVAGEEERVCDAVNLGVDLDILNGFGYILDADYLACLSGHEVGNGAGSSIKIVY